MVDTSCPLRAGDTVRIRDERWVVQGQSRLGTVTALDVRGLGGINAGRRARFLLPFEPIEPIVASRTPLVVSRAAWRHAVRSTVSTASSSPDSLRTAARARFEVMPYQLEPALAVTGGHACRLLIADEVGLGKTVQAALIIAEVLERHRNGRALVVCPAGLRGQWEHELQQRFDLGALVLDAAGIDRFASGYAASANPWSAVPLTITSIDFLKRPEVLRAIEGLVWDVLVLDEAHHLTTRSDRAAAAGAIATRARTLVMLSATPHSGDEPAFARLCSLGDVRSRFPLILFRRTRHDAGVRVSRRSRWLRLRPTTAELRMHTGLMVYARRVWVESEQGGGAQLAMTTLLRRAASSAESLGRSLERRLASLAEDQAAATQLHLAFGSHDSDEEPDGELAAPGLDDRSEERRLIEQLLGLTSVAARHESKVAAMLRWIARAGEPVLIFTEYRDTLVRLRDAFAGDGIATARLAELHGGLTRSERTTAERRFSHGDADVLLATDAASEGLNLHQRCRCVVNFDLPWSPVRLEQRIGRVDRIGQQKRVHALHLVATHTFELSIAARLIQRAATAAGALQQAGPSHEATAGAILTGIDIPESQPLSVSPSGVRRLDLSARARVESNDIASARRLLPGPGHVSHRPAVTVRARCPRRLISGFEVTVTDADGVTVWTTLIGFDASINSHHGDLGGRRAVADAVSQSLRELDDTVDSAMKTLHRQAGGILRAFATLAREREQAIAAAVQLRHARLAADLLQPGLFDRRTERRAAAQTAVLEEAVGRCHARLESLARLSDAQIGPARLRFALFLR